MPMISLTFKRTLTKVTNQIYLHPQNQISFSKNPQALTIGQFTSSNIHKDQFIPNPHFLPTLHQIIKEKVHEDFSFIMEASVNANSFMPIYDFRDVPKYGRIPEIDNVFGYLQVDTKGKMIENSYEANDMYSLFNVNGLINLSEFLLEEIRKH